MDYISAHDAAKKWNISQRRVSVLCIANRIPDAKRVGNMWIIPSDAKKPSDARKGKKKEKTALGSARPFLKWAGGKGQLLEIISNSYPPALGQQITKYAEPFVGGGAILFDVLSKFKLESAYISDTNQELINTYIIVRDHVEELISILKTLQSEFLPLNDESRKEYYYNKRDEFNSLIVGALNDNNLMKAALLIFLNRTCFNGLYRVNRRNEFNVPMGSYKNPKICDPENLRAVSAMLKSVIIVCGDYTLSESFIGNNTFVYIDPPYRPLTKTASFTAYTENDFDDKAQIALAHYIDRLTEEKQAFILVSNSDPKNSKPQDDFFDELYEKHNIRRVNAIRLINRNADSRGEISELLISNY